MAWFEKGILFIEIKKSHWVDFYHYRVVVYTHCQHTFMFKQHAKVSFASDDPFNTPDSDYQLVRRELHAWTVFLIDMIPTKCSVLPTPWAGEIHWSLLHFGTFIHGFALRRCLQRFHTQMKLTREVWIVTDIYTSVNKYNLNSRLAHFNALLMEHIRSLQTGIIAEYPAMSTSQGT